jgi:glyoxylase-like metal-dependent hydrolase (beta-lactamase superfamily II)
MTGALPVSGLTTVEIADRIWVVRPEVDAGVNVVVVAGAAGQLVVDPSGTDRRIEQLVGWLAERGGVVAVVDTHGHGAHTGGNAALRARWPQAPVVAHEAAGMAGGPPDRSFSSVTTVDLGDRVVELLHPGRGHSAGDLVALVPGTGVVAVGDLVAGSGLPAYGADCYPLEWPATLDLLLGLLSEDSIVVPGHGNPLDRAAVDDQRAGMGVLAESVRDLAGRAVPVEQALAEADWPFPREALDHAVRRGYDQLPRSARRLPLL